MKGCRKLLVAVNGSLEVLRHGLELADHEKTWITVLKVVPPNEGDLNLTGVKNIGDVLDGGARLLSERVRAVADEERTPIKTRIEEGAVHRKIVEVAREERCDLIVLGARKRRKGGVLARLLGDRVMEKVIEQAPCPVFVVDA
jgi:nucleotide-binding universal stress UspA family protein